MGRKLVVKTRATPERDAMAGQPRTGAPPATAGTGTTEGRYQPAGDGGTPSLIEDPLNALAHQTATGVGGGIADAAEWFGDLGKSKFVASAPMPNAYDFKHPGSVDTGYGTYRQDVQGLAFAPDRAVPQAAGVQLGYVPPAQAAQLNYGAMAPGLGVAAGGLMAGEQARGLQGGNLALLGAAATGQVPSAAEGQLNRGLDAGLRQNLAMAASARGTAANQAQARRNAIDANTSQVLQTQGAAAQLRAQEQAVARQQLTGALETIRAQDLGVAGVGTALSGQGLQGATAQLGADTQTGLGNLQAGTQGAIAQLGADQSIQLANVDAQLKSRGMDDQTRLAYLAQLVGIDTSTQEGQQAFWQLYVDSQMKAQQINAGTAAANAGADTQKFGQVLTLGGTVGGAIAGGG